MLASVQALDSEGVEVELSGVFGPVESAFPRAMDLEIQGDYKAGGKISCEYLYEGGFEGPTEVCVCVHVSICVCMVCMYVCLYL